MITSIYENTLIEYHIQDTYINHFTFNSNSFCMLFLSRDNFNTYLVWGGFQPFEIVNLPWEIWEDGLDILIENFIETPISLLIFHEPDKKIKSTYNHTYLYERTIDCETTLKNCFIKDVIIPRGIVDPVIMRVRINNNIEFVQEVTGSMEFLPIMQYCETFYIRIGSFLGDHTAIVRWIQGDSGNNKIIEQKGVYEYYK